MLIVTPQLQIPLAEVEITFVRSSGPGGQNVNKVNSKAVLRWNVAATPSLPFHARSRFLSLFASRLTSTGELVMTSDRFRDQGKNVDDCFHVSPTSSVMNFDNRATWLEVFPMSSLSCIFSANAVMMQRDTDDLKSKFYVLLPN